MKAISTQVSFAEKLGDLMEQRRLNQDALARLVRKSQKSISNWLLGNSVPRKNDPVRELLANALGVAPQVLFGVEHSAGSAAVAPDLQVRPAESIQHIAGWLLREFSPRELKAEIVKALDEDEFEVSRVIQEVLEARVSKQSGPQPAAPDSLFSKRSKN